MSRAESKAAPKGNGEARSARAESNFEVPRTQMAALRRLEEKNRGRGMTLEGVFPQSWLYLSLRLVEMEFDVRTLSGFVVWRFSWLLSFCREKQASLGVFHC